MWGSSIIKDYLFHHQPPVEDQLLYNPIMLVTEYVADMY